jgi:hypothetical protein
MFRRSLRPLSLKSICHAVADVVVLTLAGIASLLF